ncbi:MAG: tetratricopeptide repeat protein [Anaerolineae bacterium]
MNDETGNEFSERMNQAAAAYEALNLGEALVAYQAAHALQPENYEATVGLARTLTRMRQETMAYETANEAVALDPQRPEGYAALGALHFLTDRHEEAITALKQALKLAPDEPDARLTLAQVYADVGQFGDANSELAAARESIARFADERRQQHMEALALHAETYVFLAEGKLPEASETAQKIVPYAEINPYAACLAYSNLGILAARGRRYDEAIEYLERALAMNPYFYRAGGALGRLLLIRHQPERAVEVLAQALDLTPPDKGATRFVYASALAKAGKRGEALAEFRLSLQEGVSGINGILARWQTVWLSVVGRYVVIGVALAALAAWLLLARPSPQTLTFAAILVLILVLQRTIGRRRPQIK